MTRGFLYIKLHCCHCALSDIMDRHKKSAKCLKHYKLVATVNPCNLKNKIILWLQNNNPFSMIIMIMPFIVDQKRNFDSQTVDYVIKEHS